MDENKISVSGFELEPAEKAIVNNIIKNYSNKIRRKIEYREIKLDMKKSERGKAFLHEVHGLLRVSDDSDVEGKKLFTATVTDYNLFSALAETFEKLIKEAEHKSR